VLLIYRFSDFGLVSATQKCENAIASGIKRKSHPIPAEARPICVKICTYLQKPNTANCSVLTDEGSLLTISAMTVPK